MQTYLFDVLISSACNYINSKISFVHEVILNLNDTNLHYLAINISFFL